MKHGPGQRVACAYHFFAHYRGAINEHLAQKSDHSWRFLGSTTPLEESLVLWDPPDGIAVEHTPITYIGPLMIQRGILREAISKDSDTLVLLGNAAWPMTWLAAIAARLRGKRVLFWTHGWVRPESGLSGFIRKRFYKLAHGLLLYGHVAKCIGMQEGFPPSKLHVIYNSLDYEAQRASRMKLTDEQLNSVRTSLFSAPDRPTAVCVSRLIPVRRIDQIIEALDVLAKRGTPWNLLLVGDGPEREHLEQLAQRSTTDVHFYGACYDQDRIAELVSACNVTVAPGKVGLTAMTALAFGTPVVTHGDPYNQMPEWEAIVDGVSGSFFQLNDIQGLADAIQTWGRSGLNPESIREDCDRVMRRFYNPAFQTRAIDRAVCGLPADDLFWLKDTPEGDDRC